MGHFYDDARYGVIERKWFGLTANTLGGDAAAGYTTGSAATTVIKVKRWYPRGPIRLVKAGLMCIATYQHRSGSVDRIPIRFLADGASASAGIVYNWPPGASKVSKFTIGSSTTITRSRVKAGAYMVIKQATPQTDKATRLTATVLGTMAFFVDYVRAYDGAKWDD